MGFSSLSEERSAWDWLTFFHDNCCGTGYGNGCRSGILPFLSLNCHWSLIINHYVSLLLYATSYRGVSNMIVEAVSCKGRSTNATTRAHAQRRWEKTCFFLFHLPFFLQANLSVISTTTMPTQWTVFPQVGLPIQPQVFYHIKLYFDHSFQNHSHLFLFLLSNEEVWAPS